MLKNAFSNFNLLNSTYQLQTLNNSNSPCGTSNVEEEEKNSDVGVG
jgi:hypothetical protein